MASPILEKDKQSRLKSLIAKGKEQGYLTYSEVNDHLPEGIVDPSQIEDIINTINDMGIQVLETAPEAESRVLSDASVSEADDETTDEAVAALASIETELGRTTDPVRMYMREMGSVELLTREGEIEIAKRIDEGLKQVLEALAWHPESASTLIRGYERVDAGEMRLNDLITGFIDPNAVEPEIPLPAQIQAAQANKEKAKNDDSDEDEKPVDTGPDRKSTHLNSSHTRTSTEVFCLKKIKNKVDKEKQYIKKSA